MNTESMTRLLAEVLDGQVESGAFGAISETRLREAMTNGPDFTRQERSLLLLSPLVRTDYRRIRNETLKDTRGRIKRHNVEVNLLPLAATTEEETVVLKSSGFTVTLYRQEELGFPWVILVQLDSTYRQAINPMTTLRLADAGGLEWLRGRPDPNGELTGAWYDSEVDLLERVRRYSLILEPA